MAFITVVDLTNRGYGQLKVLERASNSTDNKARWVCLCSCGNKKIIRASNLNKPNGTVSCGCLARQRSSEVMIKIHTKNRPQEVTAQIELYGRYKRAAHDKLRSFLLSQEEFNSIISRPCHYCGKPPSQDVYAGNKDRYNRGFKYTGIDRRDNSLGYIIENCLPCCRVCNLGKHNLSYEDFTNHIEQLVTFRMKNHETLS